MNLSRLINNLWSGANLLRWRHFRRALQDPDAVQGTLLRRALEANADSEFGRRHGFASIQSVEQYRQRVPLSCYEDYQPAIERIRKGEARVLTCESVQRLVPTSGSAAAGKLIPYTRSLSEEFRRGIKPWIADLFRHRPDLKNGPAYWAVSPVLETPAEEVSVVPVGFDDDSEYLGGWLGWLVGRTFAAPAAIRSVPDVESWRYLTLLFLLRARELRLVSVWHPSFFTLLLEPLTRHWDRLLDDISHGRMTPPQRVEEGLRRRLESYLTPDPERAGELRQAGPGNLYPIWPRLGLISCWGDAHAGGALPALRDRFPEVEIQPKGLISTEAFVTLPFEGGWPVAVGSHFFEFLDDADRLFLAGELRADAEYTVVVTTGGGFYRYRLHDRVRVEGFSGRTPSLRFLGKEDQISDHRGEKLSDAFVAGAVRQALAPLGAGPVFVLLAPDQRPGGVGYTLYLESRRDPPPELARQLDKFLSDNPHYAYCRRLEQLGPVRVFRVASNARHVYLEECWRKGRRLGDVKPAALSPETGWSGIFDGAYC